MSPRVSRPCQPISSQRCGGIGSVAIIELFIGSQRRRWPGSRAVKPSVARNTTGAVTVPRGVVAEPAAMAVTGVPS